MSVFLFPGLWFHFRGGGLGFSRFEVSRFRVSRSGSCDFGFRVKGFWVHASGLRVSQFQVSCSVFTVAGRGAGLGFRNSGFGVRGCRLGERCWGFRVRGCRLGVRGWEFGGSGFGVRITSTGFRRSRFRGQGFGVGDSGFASGFRIWGSMFSGSRFGV